MRRRVRFGGLAALAAVLGMATIPAAGYSTPGKATLIVHVYSTTGRELSPGEPFRVPDESARLRITRLGHGGRGLSSWTTRDHTLHVASGRYEIAFATETAYRGPRRVLMKAGQTREVTLTISLE